VIPGIDAMPWTGDADRLLDEVEEFLTGQRHGSADRVLTTVLFTDIAESTTRAALAILDATAGAGLRLRAGLHTGECERRGDDLAGMAVHIASRVCGHAAAGEILVSRTVCDVVTGSGLELESRGEFDLKGLPQRWELFAVKP
jgi:class 3 adenylate cyclase